MSNSKLDAAKAARYWGCDVICAPYTGQPNKKLTGKMIGVTTDSLYIKFPEWATSHGMFVSDCQLLLTPLSAITDEHAIEVAKIDDKNYDYIFGNNRSAKPDLYKAIWNGKTMFVERYCKGKYIAGDPIPLIPSLLNIEQIDLLRSLGYDCDNAISEGWAVDKTTIDNK